MKTILHTLLSLLFLTVLATLTACSSGNGGAKDAAQADSLSADSGKTVLALLPTLDCLPYYYAAQQGYFDRQGLSVHVQSYDSQWDCDTAIMGRTAAIGVTDVQRVEQYNKKRQQLTVLHTLPREYALMVCGRLRLKSLKDLKLRTIGQTRNSQVSHWSEVVEQAAGIPSGEAMRPQVNALSVRTSMLNENQLDAALLPEPYITVARLAGHKQLWTSPTAQQFTCLALRGGGLQAAENSRIRGGGLQAADKRRITDTEDLKRRLLAAYNMAVDSLNTHGKDAARRLLIETYHLQPAVVDSLKWPRFVSIK